MAVVGVVDVGVNPTFEDLSIRARFEKGLANCVREENSVERRKVADVEERLVP